MNLLVEMGKLTKKAVQIALIGGLLMLGAVGPSWADGGAPTAPSPSPSSGVPTSALLSSAVLFTDVPQDHWALADLQFLAERGIITGLPNGQFQGDKPLTRYAAAALVARAIRFLQNNPDLITTQDLQVLQELIYKINDRLQEMGTELDQLRTAAGTAGPSSAALKSLQTKVQQNAQAIQSLQSQVQMSRAGAQDLQKLRDQAGASFIIALAGLFVGIIGIALATM